MIVRVTQRHFLLLAIERIREIPRLRKSQDMSDTHGQSFDRTHSLSSQSQGSLGDFAFGDNELLTFCKSCRRLIISFAWRTPDSLSVY